MWMTQHYLHRQLQYVAMKRVVFGWIYGTEVDVQVNPRDARIDN
jgi:hypothetical protein